MQEERLSMIKRLEKLVQQVRLRRSVGGESRPSLLLRCRDGL